MFSSRSSSCLEEKKVTYFGVPDWESHMTVTNSTSLSFLLSFLFLSVSSFNQVELALLVFQLDVLSV